MEEEDDQICRMCMSTQSDPILNWHEELFKSSGMSYKDCYYKYTQLEEIVSDPFSQFLCGDCSADLKNFNLLIEKAIENQRVFEQNLGTNIGMETDRCSLESEIDPNLKTECVYVIENDEDTVGSKSQADESEEESLKPALSEFANIDVILNDGIDIPALKSTRTGKGPQNEKKDKKSRQAAKIPDEEKSNTSKKYKYTPGMCSYCSRIIYNVHYLKKHEQTHKENRAREQICTICGLKTFTSAGLRNHMMIHDKHREKKYKCEFCDKAFFDRGACNVHRRIHLGQMVKCTLCPKEYCRQIDLDRHMASHSVAPLHSDKPQPTLKYVIHCKECNKDIKSNYYNAHRAVHMNDPLMRCIICEKDFFCRSSCTRHMRKVHKRAKDNYDDITTYYGKHRPRRSHLLMEQQDEVQARVLE